MSNTIGQSIRKDHKEMTPDERDAFVNALLNEEGLIQSYTLAASPSSDTLLLKSKNLKP